MFKKNTLRAVAAAALIFSSACGLVSGAEPQEPRSTFYPAETDSVLSNPYTGFATDARYLTYTQPVRLAHANITWREIEPEEGKFDFAAFERSINMEEWRTRKVSLIIRVVLDTPRAQKHLDIPDWLYEAIGQKGTWYDIDYGKGFSPDYSNTVLISKHKRLVEALGKRYGNDPNIAFVQLGSIGHWGEWHTWDDGQGRIPFPKQEISDVYVKHYLDAFPNKKLLMRRPHWIALENRMGLFNDTFGNKKETVDGFYRWYTEGYTSWLTQEPEPAMPDFWVSAPSGGEFASGSDYFSDSKIEETLRQAKLTHVTWMGPSAPVEEPANGKRQANIDRFLKTIGYRFAVAAISHEQTIKAGRTMHIEMNMRNRGVAPFYFNWPVELTLWAEDDSKAAEVRPYWNVRGWLPGEKNESAELALPGTLQPGKYTLAIAILDPSAKTPGIQFAMTGVRPDGRYAISEVVVRE